MCDICSVNGTIKKFRLSLNRVGSICCPLIILSVNCCDPLKEFTSLFGKVIYMSINSIPTYNQTFSTRKTFWLLISVSQILFLLSGCGTSVKIMDASEKEGVINLEFPTSRTFVFTRKSAEKKLWSNLLTVTARVPDQALKQQIISDRLAILNPMPESEEKVISTDKDKLEIYALKDAFKEVMWSNPDKVFKYENRWTHKHIVPKNKFGINLDEPEKGHFDIKVLYIKEWVWGDIPSKPYRANGYVRLNLTLDLVPRKEKGIISSVIKIKSVESDVPKALGIRQIADLNFDLNAFKKALKLLPQFYLEKRITKPDDPYSKEIESIIVSTKLTVDGLVKDEQIRKLAQIKSFREHLSKGDDSNCGLVVEVEAPIASVQTNRGMQWIKIDQLYPAGFFNCRYSSGDN